jgi:hypothetical protein
MVIVTVKIFHSDLILFIALIKPSNFYSGAESLSENAKWHFGHLTGLNILVSTPLNAQYHPFRANVYSRLVFMVQQELNFNHPFYVYTYLIIT